MKSLFNRNVRKSLLTLATLTTATICATTGFAANPGKIVVQVDKPGAKIADNFYGIMTEEINFAYDGGLYAELIQNRNLRNTVVRQQPTEFPAGTPVTGIPHWFLVKSANAAATCVPDSTNPINTHAQILSLKLSIASVPAGGRVGVANNGYWGIPVKPKTTYQCSFYAKASDGFSGPLTVGIESNDGTTVFASAKVSSIGTTWKRYSVTLKTGTVPASGNNYFVISAASKGTVNVNLVSLFPPVYKERKGAALGGRPITGFRPDIMQLLKEQGNTFLRFPGGNYLEGPNYDNRWYFKTTIGPWEDRPGHQTPWGYRSSDGVGLLEFLEWCEEINMEPIVGLYAGLHIDGGRDIRTGDALKPHIQDALDEIEYMTGDVNTTWGARRAKDGHPKPFKINFVEIGNEDWLNNGTASYKGPDGRYAMFYKVIKAKYPNLQIIATLDPGPGVPCDVIDNHHYMSPATSIRNAHLYDTADRKGPKLFEGEWASQEATRPRPLTPTLEAAVADGAFMTGLERNADIVIMAAYAPYFCRVEQGGSQWQTNLIGYNNLVSYGSVSYYTQKMFFNNKGNWVLPVTGITPQTIPTVPAAPAPAPTQQGAPTRGNRAPEVIDPKEPLFACASKDDKTGDIILKVVNVFDVEQTMTIELNGASIKKKATGQVMTGKPSDTNSVEKPLNVIPKGFTINDASANWTHTFPGTSVTVIRFKTK